MGTNNVTVYPEQERFWRRVQKTESCWIWRIGKEKEYGRFLVDSGKHVGAHRYSWTLVNGEIPNGMHILHSCDNPKCVNPNHLSIGTHQDNMKDRSRKGRTIFGSSSPNAKLTSGDVKKILAMWKSGDYTQVEISEHFPVSRRHVCDIVRGKTWTHIQLGGQNGHGQDSSGTD